MSLCFQKHRFSDINATNREKREMDGMRVAERLEATGRAGLCSSGGPSFGSLEQVCDVREPCHSEASGCKPCAARKS